MLTHTFTHTRVCIYLSIYLSIYVYICISIYIPQWPRVTTSRKDCFILHQHLQDRFTTTIKTARHTTGTQQRPISADTVPRRLASNTIHCRRPARGPILTDRHRQDRLQWATARQDWCYQQWRRVLLSDESRFCISMADGRVRVWRKKG